MNAAPQSSTIINGNDFAETRRYWRKRGWYKADLTAVEEFLHTSLAREPGGKPQQEDAALGEAHPNITETRIHAQ